MKKTSETFTVEQELQLVERAQNGDTSARDRLFFAYEDVIRKAHNKSDLGFGSATHGYKRNFFGRDYEDYRAELFLIFNKALRKFDPKRVNLARFSHDIPFRSFLKDFIRKRATDEKRKCSKNAKREKAMSFPENTGDSVSALDYISRNVPIENTVVGQTTQTGWVNNADIGDNFRPIINILLDELPKGGKEGEFVKFFLEEAECEKKVMPAVAKKMGVSRADAYIIRKRISQKLPPKLREEFLIAAA